MDVGLYLTVLSGVMTRYGARAGILEIQARLALSAGVAPAHSVIPVRAQWIPTRWEGLA